MHSELFGLINFWSVCRMKPAFFLFTWTSDWSRRSKQKSSCGQFLHFLLCDFDTRKLLGWKHLHLSFWSRKQNNVTALTLSIFFLFLFVVLVGPIGFCFKGYSFPCWSGTGFLGSLIFSLALQNLCKMLHRKLNQVRRLAAKHLHCVSLQQLFQTNRYLNSTHPVDSEVTGRSLMVPKYPTPNLYIRYLELKCEDQLDGHSSVRTIITGADWLLLLLTDSLSQQLIDFFI